MKEQERQDRALLSAANIEHALVLEHFERPQDPKVHPPRASNRS
jgi:hypothetical protein